jgi:hypothetical protein
MEPFHRHGVEFIVIGGVAEQLHGGSRVTYDVDLCYRRTKENFIKLAKALQELNPSLRGAPAGLPFQIDAKTLEMGQNFTFNTEILPLDVLGFVEPLGGYDEIRKHAVLYMNSGKELWTIDAEELLQIKLHLNRPKDQESIAQLRAILRVKKENESKPPGEDA